MFKEFVMSEKLGAGERLYQAFIRRFVIVLCSFCLAAAVLAVPFSLAWLYQSGDLAIDRAIGAQEGDGFALYGPGWGLEEREAQPYKLKLYAGRKPDVLVLGSSSALSLRSSVFSGSMVNMAGTASSLSTLRASLDAALRIHKPQAIILAVDFWWFSPAWEKDPFEERSLPRRELQYGPDTLKAPWTWLMHRRISLGQFFAPLYGGFREDRFGARAQWDSEGFGPDGSWYPLARLTGDEQGDEAFADSLSRQKYRLREFAPSGGLSSDAVDAFADIFFRIKGRGIRPIAYITPVAAPVYDAMLGDDASYRHLFDLKNALMARGIEVLDASDPRTLGITDCEFLDGLRVGEVGCDRILHELTNRWPELLSYVNMEKLNRVLNEWPGHAWVRDERVSDAFETDYLKMGCLKKTP